MPLEIGHVLFVDIVGYSKLLINEQRELLEHLKEMVRGSEQVRAAEAEGKLIRLATGDGMALVFRNNPEAPAHCALELSRADKEHPELQLRMGIHSGPISQVADVNERANVTGAGINMAQRVMDCGDAGHILISKRAADDLAEYRHWQSLLHELGECEVKHGVRVSIVNLYTDELGNREVPKKFTPRPLAPNESAATSVPRPVSPKALRAGLIAVLALALSAGLLYFLRAGSRPQPNDKSIAVLPFENLSEDKANAYFADGMQDEIITRLAKIGELRVIARSSTLRYKTKPEDLSRIAQELGVSNFLEGTVQKVGARVRINLQLIRAGANDHLWAEIYDRNLTDIFAVQSELATAIARTLQAKLTSRERAAVAAKPTSNLGAYDAYLRGLDLYTRSIANFENRTRASDAFQEAIRLDPKFAQAWSALSIVNAWIYFSLDTGPPRDETARVAAETATRLDPSSPETLLANAYYRYFVPRNYEGARVLFEKIHEQVPSNAEALGALARIARRQGRWNDSLRFYEEATKLNPRDTLLLSDRSRMFTMVRQNIAAHAMIDRALEIDPGDAGLLEEKIHLYHWEGNLPAAKSVLDQLASAPQTDYLIYRQVWQFVLSRSYDQAERLLIEHLATKGSKPELEVADLREELGFVQLLAGKMEAARQTCLRAKNDLVALQREQPKNHRVAAELGFIEARLGEKQAALREGERGVALRPASEDAVWGPVAEEDLAGIEALVGEPERALARIERLLTTPYGPYPLNQASLRLDPIWDSLRSSLRFKAIVEGPEPKTIYE